MEPGFSARKKSSGNDLDFASPSHLIFVLQQPENVFRHFPREQRDVKFGFRMARPLLVNSEMKPA